MTKTRLLQEIRKMRFEEAYGGLAGEAAPPGEPNHADSHRSDRTFLHPVKIPESRGTRNTHSSNGISLA